MHRKIFREARQALGKSQEAMAADLDVSKSYIRHIEAGRCTPATETAIRISKYLGLSVETVFANHN